jgi:hypothetical protein
MTHRPDQRPPISDDHLDALIRRAALAGPVEQSDTPANGLPLLTRLLLAAGLLGVAGAAIGLAVILTRPTQPSPTPTIADATPPPPELTPEPTVTETSKPTRSFVVARFTPEESKALAAALFPANQPAPDRPAAAEPVPPPDTTPDTTPDPARRDHLLALGRALRSAMNANDTLDLMPPAEQVEACRVWAADPSLRPVAFERLQHLASNPALADKVRHTAEALARDTAMRPWLMSYGFQDTARASADKAPRRTTKGGA